MSQKHIDKLIVNDAYAEPTQHWAYLREKQEFELREGRRKAGYWKLSGVGRRGTDDQGEFVPIELVNQIRPRVLEWKAKGYPNVTGTTRNFLNSGMIQLNVSIRFSGVNLKRLRRPSGLTRQAQAKRPASLFLLRKKAGRDSVSKWQPGPARPWSCPCSLLGRL